jgi:crotonobetainyl-CoA:carnitine CoA-transferase CaiB-like acyl-CoA transferase
MTPPLEGVRVLAVSQFGAGPFATMNLADLGADVVKIEDPSSGGDVSRTVPPYRIDGDSLYFQSFNRNKRSITLDLRHPQGQRVFQDLASVADGVLSNLRGDQPARLGLTYDALKARNPRIVCCSLNAFGSAGDRAAEPGYDYLMQAYAGYMSITGDPSAPPAACGVSVIDYAAGFAAAFGLVSALYAARQTGIGRDVEVSLFDTAHSMLTYLAAWSMNRGFEPARYPGSSHQTLTPVQTFRTQDGHITLFCGKEKFWALLCEAIGKPALATEPGFSSFDERLKNREAVVARVQEHLLSKTTAEWIAILKGKVPCAPVRTIGEALRDPDLVRRGMILEVDHPHFGAVREVNTPVHLPGAEPRPPRRAPELGEHTNRILQDWLDYSDEHIEALRRSGVC